MRLANTLWFVGLDSELSADMHLRAEREGFSLSGNVELDPPHNPFLIIKRLGPMVSPKQLLGIFSRIKGTIPDREVILLASSKIIHRIQRRGVPYDLTLIARDKPFHELFEVVIVRARVARDTWRHEFYEVLRTLK